MYVYIRKRLGHQYPEATIIVGGQTEERLCGTCFRGQDQRLAGNFKNWGGPNAVFADKVVLEEFLLHVYENYRTSDKGSFTIDCESIVGWESTDLLQHYRSDELEPFEPNRKSRALRVKVDRTDILAPTTTKVTIVFNVVMNEGKAVIIVHSLYPGEDVGPIVDDITVREKRVFFDWNHPGTPVPN